MAKKLRVLVLFPALLGVLLVGIPLVKAAEFVTIDQFSGSPGTTLNVNGGGFTPGETVSLRWGSSLSPVAATATVGQNTLWGPISLNVPLAQQGTLLLFATGNTSGLTAENGFYVILPMASISIAGTANSPGSSISVSGTNFGNEQVKVFLASSSSLATANGSGSFSSASFVLPFLPTGVYLLQAQGQTTGAMAWAYIYIGGFYPSATASNYFVTPGGQVSFSGSGFAPAETITVLQGTSTTPILSLSANSSGSFTSDPVTVAYGLTGQSVTYTVKGAQSKSSIPITISIGALYPSVSPSTYYVLSAQTFFVSGSGFAPNETVSITAASSTISATADGGGNFGGAGPLTAPYKPGPLLLSASGGTSGAVTSVTMTVGSLYPTVSPSAYYILPGQTLDLSGSGFAPNEDVGITVGTNAIATVKANQTGGFTTSIPVTFKPGAATLHFAGALSGATFDATITIGNVYPYVTADNYYVVPGTPVTLSGFNFIPNEPVTVAIQGGSTLSLAADGTGQLTTTIDAPYATGKFDVTMTGGTSSASAMTTVTLAPFSIQVAPSLWWTLPGTNVTFTGTGFVPNEDVSVTVNSTESGSIKADASGNFTKQMLIPFGSSAANYIFTGSLSKSPYSVPIGLGAFYPWTALSNYYSLGGTQITIFGGGYSPGETLNIDFGGVTLGPITADSSGNFSFPTNVPYLEAGTKTVTVTGALSGVSSSTTFTQAQIYTLNLQLGAYAGAPGDHINFIGSGYLPNETITVTTDKGTTPYTFNSDASGNFNDSGFVIPASTTPGVKNITVTGNHSMSPKTIAYYVTGG